MLNLIDQMDRLISEESISIDPLYLVLGGLTILIITLIFVIPSILRFLASRFLPLEFLFLINVGLSSRSGFRL